jgi:stage II sporulation protein AA (anti-sigma F factor antagonist)
MSQLQLEVARAGGVLVVRVAGDLDLCSAGWLTELLEGVLGPADPRAVLDLAELRFCDAAAMTTLLRAAAWCRDHGGWLRLAAPAGMVAHAFAVVAFGAAVPTYATVAAAVAGDDARRVKD